MKVETAILGYLLCIVGVVTGRWTEWSVWSSCSRTCGGGTSSQGRTCVHNSSDTIDEQCNGQGIRYRICGMQNCSRSESGYPRDVCSALDDVQVRGETFKWSSLLSGSATGNDCYISCSPVNGNAIEPVYMAQPDGTPCRLHGLPASDSALPGQGVCLAGACQTVGCDDVIGSKTVLDGCGFCGGDDTTCPPEVNRKQSRVEYQWRESGYTACSTTCGIGEESVIMTCRDMTNDIPAPDELCRVSLTAGDKPHLTRVCFGSDCDDGRAVWISDEWQRCSQSCGVGRAFRTVYCVLQLNDETFERASEDMCRYEQRPDTEQKCNEFECPEWIAGQWSHCSVSCGVGIQQRAIVCKRTDALDCVSSEKPHTRRPCRLPTPCPFRHTAPEIWNSKSDSEALHGVRDFEGSFDINGKLISDLERGNEVAEHVAPENQRTPKGISTSQTKQLDATEATESAEIATMTTRSALEEQHLETLGTLEESWEQHQTTQEQQTSPRTEAKHSEPILREDSMQNKSSSNEDTVILEPGFEDWNTSLTYDGFEADYGNETEEETSEINYDEPEGIDGEPGEKEERDGVYRGGPAIENKKATTIPSFVVSQWSRCSASCGIARRRRKVGCKVLLEPSRNVQDLPDFNCPGPKPIVHDYCALPECASKPEPKTQSWMLTGYGQCSKTCAGGSQDGEFHCIRIPKYYKVDNIRCLGQPVPSGIKRPCNTQPCPPRWNPLPYGQCSVSCGGGQHVRRLQCVQDTHDQKMKIVPDAQCNDVIDHPSTSAPCNLVPCPAKWVIDNWTQCSVTCGQGIQTRSVKCEQKLSSHQSVAVDDDSCWHQTDKPDTERTCESGKCHTTKTSGDKSTVIRSENSNFVQLKSMSSLSVTVGTNASLIAGSLIIIQCPLAKKFNRVNVVWLENDRAIDLKKRRRFRVDRHGGIRIRNSRPSDRGVYTCIAGEDSANTTIQFPAIGDSLREMRTRMNFVREEKKKAIYTEDFMKNFQSELKKLFAKMRRGIFSGQFLISKLPTNSVPLQYVPFHWSPCSAECGGGGIQSREVICTILAEEFFLEVDEGFCSDRRLQKPIADRDCGFGRCPHWSPESWGQCDDYNCTEVGVGERRRELRCVSPVGERLEPDRCRDQPKPNDRENCENDNCMTVWKPSNWTQCSISCGGRGIKTRRFQCVWRQSKKPVIGSLCSLHPRPASSKSCYVTTPCANTGCRDESKYCHMIPGLQMCRFPQYRQECCLSCSLVRVSTPQLTTSPNSFIRK